MRSRLSNKANTTLQAKNVIVEINNSVDRFNTWLDSTEKEEELISSELCKNKLYQKSIQKDQETETKKERPVGETVRSFHIHLINAPERDGDRQMKEIIFLKIMADNFLK